MKIEKALARRDLAIVRLRDLFSEARICGMASAEMNRRVSEIEKTTLANCPAWTRSYFDGYRASLTEQLYRQSLVLGGYFEGKFYSTHRNRPDYYESNGIAPSEFADNGKVSARGHYWSTTETPRPFFIG